jgi:hypothetical protein
VKLTFKNSFMFVLIILTMIFSAIGVTPALADDGTPPPPTTEEVAEGSETSESAQPPAEEPVAAEEPAATEEAATPVVEVLEQLPAETSLVVLDESGVVVPLATEEAAQVLAAPDPYFTVGGTLYQFTADDCDPDTAGDQPCATPIQTAIDYLAGLDATPDDNTIWVEADEYNENVTINGSDWFSGLGDLRLIGAGSGSTTINGYLDVYNLTNPFTLQGFTFTDWVYLQSGDAVEVYDVVVDGADSYGGLYVYSGGSVTLQDVESYESSEAGADVEAVGDISIYDSTFEENAYSGLYAYSESGSITLDGVTASNNIDGDGADVEAVGDISIYDSTFEENAYDGLYVDSESGSVTLNGVIASGNGNWEGDGARVYADDNISIWDSAFEKNDYYGLYARSYSGSVMLDGVTANDNSEGARLRAEGDVQAFDSVFSDNDWYGLEAESYSGSVTLDEVMVSGGDEVGAYLESTTTVDVYCSEFSSSYWGIYAYTPDLYLNGVTFSGNTDGDYENEVGNVWVNEYDCNPVPPVNSPVSKVTVENKETGPLFIVLAQTQDQLPGALGSGNSFGSALKVALTELGKSTASLKVMLSFPIPAGMKDADLAVMFWNGSAWVEMSGGNVVGDFYVITVRNPGTYVLVSQ